MNEEESHREAPTPCILVVDDDPLICQQLERLYSLSGYAVEVASSGEKAVERLESGDIDLVVSDIRCDCRDRSRRHRQRCRCP
jgi:CheY-like chemotaxis protein